eukprot:468392_1
MKNSLKHGHAKYVWARNIISVLVNIYAIYIVAEKKHALNGIYFRQCKEVDVKGYGGPTKYIGRVSTDGQPEGYGKTVYHTGNTYEGGMKNSLKHGHAKYVWASGSVYEGEYKYDKRHGHGKYVKANGEVYEGEWK